MGGERAEFTIPKLACLGLDSKFNEREVNIMIKAYFGIDFDNYSHL